MWEYHAQHPELSDRAGRAMTAFTKGFNFDRTALTTYDWSALARSSSTPLLVDVGGGNGSTCIEIARVNPNMQFIVQDIPDVVANAQREIPADVQGRIKLVAHDFFQPQPTVAQAFLFRQIFHNWSDAYCLKILRALIPALRPGVKVLINDNILSPPGVLPPMQVSFDGLI